MRLLGWIFCPNKPWNPDFESFKKFVEIGND